MTSSDHLFSWINKIILVYMGCCQVMTGRQISIRDYGLLLQRRNGSRLAVNRLEAKLIDLFGTSKHIRFLM
jgi:hypothetical protein